MKRIVNPFLFLCAAVALCGCALDAPLELGEPCNEVSFVWPDESSGAVRLGENETYDYYLKNRVCPPDHQICLNLHGFVHRGSIDENGDYQGDIVYPDEWYCSDRRESCPQNSHLVTDETGVYCERDSALRCGSVDNNCMDSAKGVDSAECVNGSCNVIKCLQGFAMVDGECKSGAQCCGDYCRNCTLNEPRQVCTTEDFMSFECGEGCALHHMIDCMGVCVDPESSLTFCGAVASKDGNCQIHYCPDMDGWRNGNCIHGVCVVSECILGYHVVADADGARHCEPDSNEVCGTRLADCTQIANAEIVSCELGGCAIQSCKDGYTLYDNECIKYTGERCGNTVCGPHAHCNRETAQCVCDANYTDCNGFCYDLNHSAYHCGSCSNICTTDKFSHSTELACFEGSCGVVACEDGYHTEDSRCMSDNCIEGATDCIHVGNIGQVRTCLGGEWSEPVSCDNYSCNNEIENCGVCINGSKKCESQLHFTCINGRWQNVIECEAPQICTVDGCMYCGSNEHPYNGSCEKHDLRNCGEHDKACDISVHPNGTAFNCDTGTCIATSCASGYHKNGDGCEKDELSNCGAHGNRCDASVRPGGSAFNCDTGTCIATSCASGYHKYGDGCEINDLTNCGSHSNRCDAGVRPNGTVFDCGTGTCVATSCASGYHKYNNGCERNDVKNCGAHGIACNSQSRPGGTAFNCDSGTCVATACSSNYHSYDNGCEENTTKNCGKHGNVCDSRSHASVSCTSGSCKYSCDSGYGDCDGKMNNGCEVNFSKHALKSCTKCNDAFIPCGDSKDVAGAPFCISRGAKSNGMMPDGCTYISDEWCYGYCNNSGESIYPNINYKQCKAGQFCYLRGNNVTCSDTLLSTCY